MVPIVAKMELTKEILQNSKWRVNPEQSKRLQEKAFELGFDWRGYQKQKQSPSLLDAKFLYFYLDTFQCGELETVFEDEKKIPERKFEDYFKDEAIIISEDISDIKSFKCEMRGHPVETPGTFMWAVEQMKQGKRVRTGLFIEGLYCTLKNTRIEDNLGERSLDLSHFEATDWEIFEENKFGRFSVSDEGDIWDDNIEDITCTGKHLDDLEKAIKYSKELQC